MSLIEELQRQLGDDGLAKLAGQIGADRQSVDRALPSAVALLTGQMGKNAKSGGAEALFGALRDHDGSILDDLGGFLGQGEGAMASGAAILGHVFGGRRSEGAAAGVAKTSGLDKGQAGQLLALLAPIVMGMLGRKQNQGGLDLGGLAGELLGHSRQARQKAPEGAGGLLGQMLDSDGDGSVMDELADLGGGLLGGLFKK